ncbi:hypothetical protein R1sor_013170 [Riccia sorocarpa]|uniref:Uncharacterized protein n=1 Tax=Riccia sorocarpa TaxID=122646 RepID=A0ABD3H9U2_9MARC
MFQRDVQVLEEFRRDVQEEFHREVEVLEGLQPLNDFQPTQFGQEFGTEVAVTDSSPDMATSPEVVPSMDKENELSEHNGNELTAVGKNRVRRSLRIAQMDEMKNFHGMAVPEKRSRRRKRPRSKQVDSGNGFNVSVVKTQELQDFQAGKISKEEKPQEQSNESKVVSNHKIANNDNNMNPHENFFKCFIECVNPH